MFAGDIHRKRRTIICLGALAARDGLGLIALGLFIAAIALIFNGALGVAPVI
jgi:hypothetical protein